MINDQSLMIHFSSSYSNGPSLPSYHHYVNYNTIGSPSAISSSVGTSNSTFDRRTNELISPPANVLLDNNMTLMRYNSNF